MAEYAYDAINAQGMLTSGVISAPDVGSAREQLQSRGLLPSSLAEKAAAGEESFGSMFKKVKPKSLQIFARQLATMIEAGVSVVAALVTLEEQTDDKYLKEVVSEVRGDVESGMIFSRALARHPKVFNRLFVAMVAAGESSGTLDIVLDRVATQIEKETKLKRRVKGAMVYPTVVISFASLVLTFMLMFIVPVFQKVFDELNGQLPTPTKIIIGMSNALRGYWFVIFPMIGLDHLHDPPPQAHAGRHAGVGPLQAAGADEDRRRRAEDCARAHRRVRSRRSSRPVSTSSRRSTSRPAPQATGCSRQRFSGRRRACTTACRSASRSPKTRTSRRWSARW